jgi:hypothetical protein
MTDCSILSPAHGTAGLVIIRSRYPNRSPDRLSAGAYLRMMVFEFFSLEVLRTRSRSPPLPTHKCDRDQRRSVAPRGRAFLSWLGGRPRQRPLVGSVAGHGHARTLAAVHDDGHPVTAPKLFITGYTRTRSSVRLRYSLLAVEFEQELFKSFASVFVSTCHGLQFTRRLLDSG